MIFCDHVPDPSNLHRKFPVRPSLNFKVHKYEGSIEYRIAEAIKASAIIIPPLHPPLYPSWEIIQISSTVAGEQFQLQTRRGSGVLFTLSRCGMTILRLCLEHSSHQIQLTSQPTSRHVSPACSIRHAKRTPSLKSNSIVDGDREGGIFCKTRPELGGNLGRVRLCYPEASCAMWCTRKTPPQ